MTDSTHRFSNRVDDYIRYRPSYPPAIVDVLVQECGLALDWTIADIGAGPGNLTRLFLDHGNAVVGVEPNREMREAGERLLAGDPRFASVEGTAEATGLPAASVDLVAAGQAFHWFDAARARDEFVRIVRPPRWVALIWNERRVGATPFLAAYEDLLLRHGSDYSAVRHQDTASDDKIAAFFGSGGYRLTTFANQQSFDLACLQGRVRSSSYVPLPGEPGFDELAAGLERIFADHQTDGVVSFDYDTRLYLGTLDLA
ncbi:MAG TPA: class I SAM-dependent methyltransferase [Thermomicrobiales bacterium]|nr:class I SAM-dependent methyltransferase [Thermomicrobiales bacterium]